MKAPKTIHIQPKIKMILGNEVRVDQAHRGEGHARNNVGAVRETLQWNVRDKTKLDQAVGAIRFALEPLNAIKFRCGGRNLRADAKLLEICRHIGRC
jgi:hypothetical protein